MAVGIVYDPIYLEHEMGDHVERPGRLIATMNLLRQSGLLSELVNVPVRGATRDEVLVIHSPQVLARVEGAARSGGGWLDPDTYVSPRSPEAAMAAVGGVLEATDAVLTGKVGSALALVRPPGHHATPSRSMGFCLFNNVAIAAARAIEIYGLERVMIVDFDVHHGNGTQEAFYGDSRVLYFSTHEYPFYPGTGDFVETGTGEGEGYTINVPLPAGSGDREYLQAFEEILLPAARRYSPQLVLVSAGYDAHWMDQLARMNVTTDGFAKIVNCVKGLSEELAGGRLVLSLEGGYSLRALSESVRATVEVLLGRTEIKDPLGAPSRQNEVDVESLFNGIKTIHGLI